MASNGIAVQTFASASAFIETYRRGDPGCLVLDVRLPGMSGPELQAYLRREAIEIPIVFVSAHGDVPTAVNAIKGGAVDFIQKPFDYRAGAGDRARRAGARRAAAASGARGARSSPSASPRSPSASAACCSASSRARRTR